MNDIRRSLRYYLLMQELKIVQMVNGLLHFMRRLPWVGKKLPDDVFRLPTLKKTLFILSAIVFIGFGLVSKFVYLVIGSLAFIYLNNFFFHSEVEVFEIFAQLDEAIWVGLFFWLLSVFALNCYGALFVVADQKKIRFMENFRISKKFFIRSEMLVEAFRQSLLYIPAAIVIGFLIERPLLVALCIPLMYNALYTVNLFLARVFFMMKKQTKHYEVNNAILISILMISGVLLAWVMGLALPMWFGTTWIMSIFSTIGLVVSVALIAGSLWALLKFKKENHFIRYLLEQTTAYYTNVEKMAASQTESLQKKMDFPESDSLAIGEKIRKNYSGNALLNHLLFKRYKRMFRKMIRYRLGLTAVIATAIIVLSSLFPELLINLGEDPALFIIFLFIWMSMFSCGKKVVQIVFVNCDFDMLHYPFYRERKVIITGFLNRLVRIVKFNLLLVLAPLFVIIYLAIGGYVINSSFYVQIFIVTVCLLLLVSFHDLFMYYMFQPYTEGMGVKNPLFIIVTSLSSMIPWFFIGAIDAVGSATLIFGLAIVTILYVSLGTLALLKFASKTFRLK